MPEQDLNPKNNIYKNIITQTKLKINEIGTKRLTSSDVSDIIINSVKIIKNQRVTNIYDFLSEDDLSLKNNVKFEWLIYDDESKIWMNDIEKIKLFVRLIQNQKIKGIDSIDKISKEVDTHLTLDANLPASMIDYSIPLSNIPPSYIRMFGDDVWNMKTKQMLSKEESKKYHFTSKCIYKIKDIEDCDKTYVEIVKRIFKTWSNNREDYVTFLYQMVFATMEGYGRQLYIILNSEGGDGKSTFMNKILKQIAGVEYTVHATLNELGQDEFLSQLDMKTNLIIGDDGSSHDKISNNNLSIVKSVIMGETRQAKRKYLNPKNVSTNAVMVGAYNGYPSIFENKASTQSRFALVDWVSMNFRSNPIEDFVLDDILTNPNKRKKLIECIMAIVWKEVEYFEKFTIPKNVSENTTKMLESSDIVSQFITELDEMGVLDSYSYLPTNIIYKCFDEWSKQMNGSHYSMSSREFWKKATIKFERKGYTTLGKTIRFSSLDSLKFYGKPLEELVNKSLDSSPTCKCFFNEQNEISEDEINDFKDNYEKISEDDFQDNIRYRQIAKYLTDTFIENRDILSKFQDLF